VEVRAGGGGGASCVALRTSSGVTPPSQGTAIGANAGGVLANAIAAVDGPLASRR
jgi:hypothetical protein